MSGTLLELEVLVLDCQASGATPALGDLLEIGWGTTSATADVLAPRAEWIVPKEDRRISAIVRQLTGWSEACRALGVDPLTAWQRVQDEARRAPGPIPTVIHFARFELAFLRDLHARSGSSEPFPLDTICVHAAAERLFPDLPRRSLRALAGHLGHSADVLRRAEGHVAATGAIWRALVPRLAAIGIGTWDELKAWLATPMVRTVRTKRVFPMPAAVRRALPDVPGVYRFVRSNGDVLYVGKATSLKKRVASHFSAGMRTTERALEMLSQAHSIDATPTPTVLEAALLETDEIKRLDPPYNVQLRIGERSAWFCDHRWEGAQSTPDATHPVGPLPSRWSLVGLAAVLRLLEGEPLTPGLCAEAVETTERDAPDLEVFATVWAEWLAARIGPGPSTRTRLLHAGDRIVAPESPTDAPPGWDPDRIRRHLDRAVVDGVTLVRRARLLSLLSFARISFREPSTTEKRTLFVHSARIGSTPADRPPSRLERLAAFDAERYDQLRILATELRRVVQQGGDVDARVGSHALPLRRARDSKTTRTPSKRLTSEP